MARLRSSHLFVFIGKYLMSDFIHYSYNTGPYGHDLTTDSNGSLNVSLNPTSGRYPYGEGDTGRTVSVDGCGRLLINLFTPSGVTLPEASGYFFGDVFYVIASGFYRRGIISWEPTSNAAQLAGGEANTASNIGAGDGIFKTKSGVDLVFKSLVEGSGVELVPGTNTITINNKVTRGIDMSIADVGNYYTTDNVEAALQTAGLKNKDFTNASGLWIKSLSSAGGASLVKTGNAPSLSIKGIIATSGLLVSVEADTLTIGQYIPSGFTLPDENNAGFGDIFYHHTSGFYKRGQYIWELQTVAPPHTSQWWQDTTPLPGTPVSLPTAYSYVRFSSIQASGGIEADHGIQVSISGIKIKDDESAGRYSVFWNISYEGSTNTTYYGALFRNAERIRASQSTSRLGNAAAIQLMSSRAIIDLGRNDELLLKFAAGANSKTINIFTMNVSLTRISAHNQTFEP